MTIFINGGDWDRLQILPNPKLAVTMTCSEGHESDWSHREWHTLDTAACPRHGQDPLTPGCPGRIDFAHARRHSDDPCDEVTAPDEAETAPIPAYYSRCHGRVMPVPVDQR